ncbi:uncharacterized protein PV09_08725 [Verruconis gallopava]|uniref:Store-operated calcium entry-associated regulatory factor n=1 Tax=Verruconis gallopava TaxID=253628 RepID=A0A0D1YFZ3_9PEZI|nr:uncharacterized protein PV09_08725 [Verruconis gallopava]KIV99671.1 hypothetical protein PV09_08725 [Verruconis gallopava]
MKVNTVELVCTLLVLLSSATLSHAAGQPKDSVLLRNIKSLTLYKDRKTTHRRVPAIPQLRCIGGSGKGYYEVDVMRCTNSGASYDEDNVDWTCKASLPPEFKLGSTDVICEGYSSPDDPYVLKGSCGVEYRLILTDLGEKKYGSKGWFKPKFAEGSSLFSAGENAGDEPPSEKLFNFIFWCFFIGVGLWIAYMFLKSILSGETGPGRRRGGFRLGGGGFGGGDDDNDPPPPYDPNPPRPSRQTHSKPRSSAWTTTSSSRNSEPWRPGFWTGAATGAAAAYAASRASRNRAEEQARQQTQGWFQRAWTGGNTYTNPRPSWYYDNAGEGPSRSSSSQSPPEPPSSSRYESTGFGSTRRR